MGITGRRGAGIVIVIITLVALLLRCLAARGGLWLDEAWSAVFAQDSATPAGVLLNVNHDNNHHLNTLWLQFVGVDASPMLQRALSIASGTATVPVAAMIAGRRGTAPAIVTAVAFAVAPFLVTYGAEARGYAPMLFAWVCAIGVVDRWLAQPDRDRPAAALALAALFGCIAQATMVFGLAALALWVVVARRQQPGARGAFAEAIRLFAPAAIVVLALAAIAWGAAAASPTGFQLGNREPHDWGKWFDALGQLSTWTFGHAVVVLAMLSLRPGFRDRLKLLLAVTALLPVAVAVLMLPNSGASRYYAVVVPPLLLWAAIVLPAAWSARQYRRVAAVGIAAIFLLNAALRDTALIGNLRGDPGRAVAALAAHAPRGTRVSVDHPRSTAILIAAARSQHYALAPSEVPCPPAPFHFVERDGDAAFPAPLLLCGRTYREIARGDPSGLSGTHWRLYARTR